MLINAEADKFVLDTVKDKNHVRFAAKEWDAIPSLQSDHGAWRRILWFQFYNTAEALKLRLIIGPGDDSVRQTLLNLGLEKDGVLSAADRTLNRYWNSIYERTVLSKAALSDLATADLEQLIKSEWQEFLADDLPKILESIRSVEWAGLAQSALSQVPKPTTADIEEVLKHGKVVKIEPMNEPDTGADNKED